MQEEIGRRNGKRRRPHRPQEDPGGVRGACAGENHRLVVKWKSPLSGVPPAPTLPEGTRVYAIGDIHGRADLLEQIFERIDADLRAQPIANPIEVFLGDYIDRGPKSAETLALLIERRRTRQAICLKGNHEIYLPEFLRNPPILRSWGLYGGLTTLLSYGLKPSFAPSEAEEKELAEGLAHRLPESHRAFLAELPLSFSCGDYFFVHAGVRPGIALARQKEEDLLWIRDEFLDHAGPFEKIIIHGHTPVMEPEVRRNRIDIDTGAYATGRLTCLRLERDAIGFI